MFRNILSSRAIFAGLVFFVLVVGGSLLYSWHVHRTTEAEVAETQRKVQPLENKNETRSAEDTTDTSTVDFELAETPPETDDLQVSDDTEVSLINEASEFTNVVDAFLPDDFVSEDTEMIEESNEYPEVPPDFPFSVVWTVPEEQRAQIPPVLFEELELMSLVMIKLWNEGDRDFAGAFMSNGRVYPTYPDVAYVKWEETEEPGERRISEVSTVHGSISEQLLNGVIPPGIEIVDQDTSGIDPHAFLSQ